jgi:protein-S-isoprenylcysteine O-methyltransferase Ste14
MPGLEFNTAAAPPVVETPPTRLPSLGARGEGWVIVQFALMGAALASGLFGPAWSGWPRLVTSAIGAGLIVAAMALFIRGFHDLSSNLTPFPKPLEKAQLVETGAYGLVRHPLYGALVIVALGWALLTASIPGFVMAGIMLGFADLKARREEAWLVTKYEAYTAYQGRRRRLIPWLY